MKNNTVVIFFFILFFSVMSCQTIIDQGGIDITIVMPESVQMVLPETENGTWFLVTGTGPEGSTFEVITESCSVRKEQIAHGEWIINVEAYNNSDELIGTGDGVVRVEEGRRVHLDVMIVPSEGQGKLIVEVLWDAGEIITPSIRGKLYPVSGRIEVLDFTVQDGGAACSIKDSMPSGYYTLAIQLLEGETVCGSSVRQILVINALTTKSVCTFSNDITGDTGNLSLSISSSFQTRTILPSIDMTINAYDLYGIGPNGAAFVRFGEQNPVSLLLPLAPGEWNVSAYALNPDTFLIGEGSESVTVRVGRTTSATLIVYPLNGDGTLRVQLSWPEGSTQQPSLEISLETPEGNPVLSERLELTGNDAQYENDAVAAGYYKMTLKIYDGTALVWTILDAIRIVAGAVTEAAYDLTL